MTSEMKAELFKAVLMCAVIYIEYRAMQPYNEPVIAKFWWYLAAWFRQVAARFGRLAITAEHNYYLAAEAGI